MSVNDDEIITDNIRLHQNYPNPFNSETEIKFNLGKTENVSIKVHNILGKEITTLLEENLPAGEYTIQWNGKDNKGNSVSTGNYFIQLQAGNYRKTIKATFLK